jgi:molybdate/tungstate transport system permease protein
LLPRCSAALAVAGAAVVWLALLAPLGALLAHLSPGGVRQAFAQPGALQPLTVSLEASALALAVLVTGCTPLSWLLARDRLPWPRVWEAGLLVPLMMPPLVVGLLLVFLVGPLTPLGHLLGRLQLSASNTFLALVIAEVYEAAPYYVLGAAAAFAAVDRELEQAAALLGRPPAAVFGRVTLPLAAPGLASALATAWARAMGAFGAVIIIAYHPYGLPMQIWTTLEEVGLPAALPFALLLVVLSLPFPLVVYAWSAHARLRR